MSVTRTFRIDHRRRRERHLHLHQHQGRLPHRPQDVVGGVGEFDFDGTGTNVTADFDITTLVAGTPVASSTFDFDGSDSQFGVKLVTETPRRGYDLTNLSCSGDTTDLVIGHSDGS